MTKNKNLFKNISIFLCLVPMLVLSLLCLIPKNKIQSVSAAEGTTTAYYTYESSNYILGLSFCTSKNLSSMTTGFEYGTFNFLFSNDPSHLPDKNYNIYFQFNVGNYVMGSGFRDFYDYDYFTGYNMEHFMWLLIGERYVPFSIYCNEGFDFYPIRLDVGNDWDSSYNVGYNVFTYYDTNGNIFRIKTGYYNNQSILYTGLVLEERTYYLKNPSTFDNNEYYNAGYNAGYSDGNSAGNSIGYKDGYSAGEITGYGNGFNAGLEQSGKYSFNSLIGAVIDAPVSAFTSLLNFELLGVNILGLVTGLLSLAVIVLIIKLCMGGR